MPTPPTAPPPEEISPPEETALADQGTPPAKQADPPMTSAEFRVLRERLGLTAQWLAEFFGVGLRNVQVWDRGDRKPLVPAARAAAMYELERAARQQVDQLVAQLRGQEYVGHHTPTVRTYVTDEQYQEYDGGQWSAGWHRAVVGRAVEAYGHRVTILYMADEELSVDN
jgi:hypothetical protein